MTTRADAETQETPATATELHGESPPPGVIDRLKRERDEAKTQAAQAAQAATQALKVDQVYEVLKAKEDLPADYDAYAAAKAAARFLPAEVEVTAESVDELLGSLASILPSQAAAPPPPPMAGDPMLGGTGVNPAGGGVTVEDGPFPIRSQQADEYVEEHGTPAFYRAIQQGLFYASPENLAAQATAQNDPLSG
ncbi:MAG: hypothetical protein ACE5D3_08525 [Candidatus Binatia bacterium]